MPVVTVGVLARFEFKVDDESVAEQFFQRGKHIAGQQPAATEWFAYRLGPGVYGAFAAFASEQDRQALLASGGPREAAASAGLFARPPSFELVDIIEARQAEAPAYPAHLRPPARRSKKNQGCACADAAARISLFG